MQPQAKRGPKKGAKSVKMPNLGEGVFVLPQELRDEINIIDSNLSHLRGELAILEAQYKAKLAEYKGIEQSAFSYFKSDALVRGLSLKNKNIELLGEFKYRLVDVTHPTAAKEESGGE